MTLKQFLKILWQEKALILGVTVLVAVVTLFFALFQPPKFEVYLDVEVKRINQAATPDYQYDQYYVIQSSDLINNTINSWFESKNFAKKILLEARFDQNDLPRLSRFLKVRKLSSQNLEIKITANTQKTAIGLGKIIKEEIQSRVVSLNLNEENEPVFRADINIGSPEQVWISILYSLLTGFFGGLFLGIFLALISCYFKK